MTNRSSHPSNPETSLGPTSAGRNVRDRIVSDTRRLIDCSMQWARRHPVYAAASAAAALSLSIALMIAIASAFASNGRTPYTYPHGSTADVGFQGQNGQDDYQPVDEYADSYPLSSNEFWGEARIGGMPVTSGTFDNSGQGAHVLSVDGQVLILPPY